VQRNKNANEKETGSQKWEGWKLEVTGYRNCA